jgi:hypothetical protein
MTGQDPKSTGASGVWKSVRWWVLGGSIVLTVVIAIGIFLSDQVISQTGALEAAANNPAAAIIDKDRADLVRNAYQYQSDNLTKLWTAIIASLTGVAAALVAYVGWLNYENAKQKMSDDRKAAQDSLEETRHKMDADKDASDKNLEIARQALITDRFTKAIDQLGSVRAGKDGPVPNIEGRLGGIYALEKIAKDEPGKYHWTIMEVLTAYVRENAPWIEPAEKAERVRIDIQTILNVLQRRITENDPRDAGVGLDLRSVDLRKAHLEHAHLDKAYLYHAHLEEAYLDGAHFKKAHLEDVHFDGARGLSKAHFDDIYRDDKTTGLP